jgi:hypothetical protein
MTGGEYRQGCGRWKKKTLRGVHGTSSCGLNLAAINYGMHIDILSLWTFYELEYE